MPASPPRISVLIRSIGRPTLGRALISTYAQALPLQVLVVPAAGADLGELPAPPDAVQLRVLPSGAPLGRGAAANRLLDAADTELLLFLDDDDWLLPGHLLRLLQALDAQREAPAAHAGVVLRSAAEPDGPDLHVYDAPAPWSELQLANRLPIHAVLFRRSVVQAAPALRMDEELGQFEDWDFWLQLMRRGGPFVHVPGVSAVYCLDVQAGSGHAAAGSPERLRQLEAFARRQLPRWQPGDVVRLIEQHASGQAQRDQLQQRLAAAQDELAAVAAQNTRLQESHSRTEAERLDLRRRLEADRHAFAAERERITAELGRQRRELDTLEALRLEHLRQLERLDGMLSAMHASTSWRVTRPLRLAGDLWRVLRRGGAGVVLRNLSLAVRQEGKRHGWLGLARRAPHYARHAGRVSRVLATPPLQSQINPFAGASKARPVGRRRLHPDLSPQPRTPIEAKVSVVIPTLNAGPEFRWLLDKLRAQRAVREVEIVVVDSGSNDGTQALARQHGARVVEIAPSEFSHSHARNLGAETASGQWLLFMVQDAYPIGEHWLFGMLSYLLDHAPQGVVAASCSEFSRSDSDLMYDCNVATHYRFLGCQHADRIGVLGGHDHMALRSQGQLSDVACLISRPLFLSYRYRGDYAEDLDLGIRLLRDGHKVAMLASIKVVHSHNRAPYYYLKRSFVDVVFLVGLFADFHCPPCQSLAGLARGVAQVHAALPACALALRQAAPGTELPALVERWLGTLERAGFADAREDGIAAMADAGDAGDARLDAWLRDFGHALPPPAATLSDREGERRAFVASFAARTRHLLQFVASVYGGGDARLASELTAALHKTFASSVGAALAFCYLDRRQRPGDDSERRFTEDLFGQLKAGV